MIDTFRYCRQLPAPRRCAVAATICGRLFFALAATALVCGCQTDARARRAAAAKESRLPTDQELSRKLVNLPFDQQIAAGAVTDRTIYDHHFAGDGVSLNVLGERQIEAMLEVATDQPLRVNLPDTGSRDGLHELRVAAVRQRFLAGGVDEKRLQIVNTTPGGPGILTEVLIEALKAPEAGGTQQRGSGNRPGGSFSGGR